MYRFLLCMSMLPIQVAGITIDQFYLERDTSGVMNILNQYPELGYGSISETFNQLSSPENKTLIARTPNETVGFIHYTCSEQSDSLLLALLSYYFDAPVALIYLLGVAPEYHYKGIGTQLLRAVLTDCYTHEIEHVVVTTQKDNKVACSFYEKNGFNNVFSSEDEVVYIKSLGTTQTVSIDQVFGRYIMQLMNLIIKRITSIVNH